MENLSTKGNILVVEDDLLIAESNKYYLKKSGYNVAGIASNGSMAIEMAKTLNPDIILMDINLGSSVDGITAAVEIKRFANIPVIFLTAFSDSLTIERAQQVSPSGYLVKPFDNRELISIIELALNRTDFRVEME